MNNKNINNIIKEINNSDNIEIHILKDMISDYRKICKKLTIFIVISVLLNLISILYYVFNIV